MIHYQASNGHHVWMSKEFYDKINVMLNWPRHPFKRIMRRHQYFLALKNNPKLHDR